MSSRSVSPGGALLRASRMFSIPPAIPPSTNDLSNLTTRGQSESATSAFPTRLSITTPYSSRMSGDWGLKRPLPLKTTTKQTLPLVRVKQVDSIEHVTDYHSASEHTITLMKFQELNLPITVPPTDSRDTYNAVQASKSVFEDDRDFTAVSAQSEELEHKRWRFRGPWLAGMADGLFDKYINKSVRGKRDEFRTMLKEHMAAELTQQQAQVALEQTPDAPSPAPVLASEISDDQFKEYVKQLRQNDRMQLYKLVGKFLDLAPVALESKLASLGSIRPYVATELTDTGPYSKQGPPVTHPSAGLSYLRTRNFMENHPVYGAQKQHPPVKARVIKPRNVSAGQHAPVLGVAGIVPDASYGDGTFNQSVTNESNRGLMTFDPSLRGGAKKFVTPVAASIASNGAISLRIQDPSAQAEVIQKEMLGETDVYEDAVKSREIPQAAPRTGGNSSWGGFRRKINLRPNQDYGLGGRDL